MNFDGPWTLPLVFHNDLPVQIYAVMNDFDDHSIHHVMWQHNFDADTQIIDPYCTSKKLIQN